MGSVLLLCALMGVCVKVVWSLKGHILHISLHKKAVYRCFNNIVPKLPINEKIISKGYHKK